LKSMLSVRRLAMGFLLSKARPPGQFQLARVSILYVETTLHRDGGSNRKVKMLVRTSVA